MGNERLPGSYAGLREKARQEGVLVVVRRWWGQAMTRLGKLSEQLNEGDDATVGLTDEAIKSGERGTLHGKLVKAIICQKSRRN